MSKRSRASAALPALALLAGLAAVPGPVAAATTIAVNTLADTANASDGKCSLREAIVAINTTAPSGGVSGECPAGTGTDLVTFKVGGTILLNASLPALTAGPSATIDGDNVITIDGRDQYGTMKITGGTVELRHLVIQNGRAAGGAVVALADTKLTDVLVRSSQSTGPGGGVYSNSALTLDHVTVYGNLAKGWGGGVAVDAGSLSMTASHVYGNTVVTDGTEAVGGGVAVYKAETVITGSRIDHNEADRGGGLYAESLSHMTLTGSTIDSNTGIDYAGGLYSSDAGTSGLPRFTIRTSTFSGNSTSGSGGAIFGWWEWMDVRTSTFAGNSATVSGGAVQQQESNDTSFVNSTFAGNSTGGGGSAYKLISGLTVFLHTTVTGNTAGSAGAALDASVEFTQIIVRNSILAGNTNGATKGNVTTAADDVIASSATGILDPAGLKDNGGPTKTVKPLKTATSVINKASDGDGCPNANVDGVDQRGVTRVVGQCDIGAVELESGKPTASAPRSAPAVGSVLGSTVPVRVTAPWSDPGGSGVARFVLQKSVNGGAWSTVTSSMPKTGITLKLSTGSSYRFRVKPVDYDGNVGAYSSTGTAGTPAIRQQTSATYSGSWSSTSSTSYSGGSAKKSSSAGASAKYTFTGRGVGFVTTFGPDRGKAKVYIDGSLKATVDLYATSTKYKIVAWSTRFSSSASHTIKVVVVGSPSRPRVDVDAFAVLK